MSDFTVFFQTGLRHVLDIEGYDHILFLIVLSLPYGLRDWKRLLLQVTVFTIGHTASLMLSAFGLVSVPAEMVEFLIPVTILCTAIYRLTKPKGEKNDKLWWITLAFGIIHGLGFSNYFNAILTGDVSEKMIPLFSFALGIEFAQIVVVTVLLGCEWITTRVLGCQRRDFNLVAAAIVVGITLPIMYEKASEFIIA